MKRLLLILILFLILASCNKGKELGEYLLGDLKNENPYIGNETLVFLDNEGDSIVFYGEGRYSKLFHTEPNSVESNNYYLNEMDVCNFSNKDNSQKLYIQISTHMLNDAELAVVYIYDAPKNQVATEFNIPLDDHIAKDSILIGGVYYDSVYSSSWIFYPEEKCYFSKKYGVVKFELDDRVWELKEVIR